MKTLFKGLLTLDAISLLIVVYMIKTCTWLPGIKEFSVILYLLIPVVIARICIFLSENLSKDSIEGGISGIEQGRAENQKSMALSLYQQGVDISIIAKAAEVTVEIVKSWLEAYSVEE